MPVAKKYGCKRPFNIFHINAGFDMAVSRNVFVIIEINKVIARCPAKSSTGSNY
jgi:hypothetical protein